MTYKEGMKLVKYTALASAGLFTLGSNACVDCAYSTLPYTFASNLQDNQTFLRVAGFGGLVAILIAASMLVKDERKKEEKKK